MTEIETALARVRDTHQVLDDVRRDASRQERDARRRRDKAVQEAHAAGASYQQIADVLGVQRSYVYQICRDVR
jgi:DNA-binding CsgD family transcriptional regulator